LLTTLLSLEACNWGLKTSGLIGLDLSELQSVQALGGEHVWLHENLTLRKLDELGLLRELEVADRTDRLAVNRAALTVTRLEGLGSSMLVHLEVTHVGSMLLLDGGLLLTPVAIKVA